jgi:hypothetical protein
MTRYSTLMTIAACLALSAAPPYANPAQGRAAAYHPVVEREAYRCPIHRNAAGNLIDCNGWRLRSGTTGWDNSCFSLDYMPSVFACSAP